MLWPILGMKRGSKQDIIHVGGGPSQGEVAQSRPMRNCDTAVAGPVCSLGMGSGNRARARMWWGGGVPTGIILDLQ